jgi:hypothetical protein
MGSSSSKERAEEEGRFGPHSVIGIRDQELQLSERHRVWQEEEMREMQKRTNYDGSHHGIRARSLGRSGTNGQNSIQFETAFMRENE